jgi:hypothetical protein
MEAESATLAEAAAAAPAVETGLLLLLLLLHRLQLRLLVWQQHNLGMYAETVL